MKRGALCLSLALVLLLFVGVARLWPDYGDEIARWALETYLGTNSVESAAPRSLQRSDAASGVPVAIRVVEEAWDELHRQETVPEEAAIQMLPGEVELRNETAYQPDFAALPGLPVTASPTVLIVHTHGSEGYADSASGNYRTSEVERSVLAVGDVLAETLRQAGISVLHDKTQCDLTDFNSAYSTSREIISQWLGRESEIFLVLDIHRDAVSDGAGGQKAMTLETEDGQWAKLMLVVGTDDGGLTHPDWMENLSLATVLQRQMEDRLPGIMRPVNLRQERFNQDLGVLSLLVEMGASGNTLEQAKASAAVLGEALSTVLRSCKAA